MPTSYNQITGQSLERLAALSDGIFAVAMTLLVLDLHVPARELIHSQGELWHTLAGAAPQLISFTIDSSAVKNCGPKNLQVASCASSASAEPIMM